ncbi:MAG: pseudouridine synthase [Pirellulaceae bacterium]
MSARPPISVLYEDNHLLIVNKPAGLPTMGVTADRESVLTLAKQYIRRKYNKPGNVYLGTVSRLDSLATGALVFARTSKAAARLTKQFLAKPRKRYWAIVSPTPDPPEDDCVNWVARTNDTTACRSSNPVRPTRRKLDCTTARSADCRAAR